MLDERSHCGWRVFRSASATSYLDAKATVLLGSTVVTIPNELGVRALDRNASSDSPEPRVDDLLEFAKRVVEAGTAVASADFRRVPLRCRGEIDGRPCAGYLDVRLERDSVEWRCDACGQRGRVVDFSGNESDLRGMSGPHPGPIVRVPLASVARIIDDALPADAGRRMLLASLVEGDDVVVELSRDGVAQVAIAVAEEIAQLTPNDQVQAFLPHLRAVVAMLETAPHGPG